MSMERARFGTLLKQYREAAALSQDALAERAGLSLDAISALESGRSKAPRLETARRLVEALSLADDDHTRLLIAARPAEPGAPAQAAAAFSSAGSSAAEWTRGTYPLPHQTTPLIGREREVAVSRDLLRRTALLTLVGPGGVGKTRLALQVAAEARAEFADGVVFVPLAPIGDPALVAAAIATALDIQEQGTRPLTTTLTAALRSRRLLLVLDNMEQVVEAAPILAELLAGCASLKILVTSRTPLHLSIEQEFTVPPLAIPSPAEAAGRQIATLQQVPAVALFLARAQRTDPDFALTAANAEAVATLCRRLDGLPLALELAAARIKILSPQAMLHRLEQRLDVLSSGSRDLPARQQTLRKTIAWSHDLLSAADQVLFARLSVFAGGCSLGAIEAICAPAPDGDTLEGVATLVDQSLLRRDGQRAERADDPRFVMLETVREFARDQLAARGEADDLSRAHARYFTTLAEEARPHMGRAEHLGWLDRLESDTENYRAALSWCVARSAAGDGDAMDLGLRLAGNLAPTQWLGRGRAREVQSALLQLLSRPEAAVYPAARARAFLGAGYLAGLAGSFTQSTALLEEGLMLARSIGNSRLAAATLSCLGNGRTDPVRRQADLEEALSLERSPGILVFLGAHYLDMGDLSRARALLEEGHVLAVAQGDRHVTGQALDVLGNIARAEGDTETARGLFEESLALRRALRDNHSTGHILRFLGEIAEEQGATEQAGAYYAEALRALRDGWHVSRIVATLRGVAALALREGQPARALRLAGVVDRERATASTLMSLEVAPRQALWARTSWEQIRAEAEQAMSPADAAAVWAEGQALSLEDAIAEVLGEVG
jgi:predicted ATPase/DNA-binding XRE family transcriptional regulator/Tfp pilus assembly protein PilF